jgi:hypothetical protein
MTMPHLSKQQRRELVRETRRIVEDGPEADGAIRWTRAVRAATREARAPLRRCPRPGCYTVTTAAHCPACHTELIPPERDDAMECRQFLPRGVCRGFILCEDCGCQVQRTSGNQRRCPECRRRRATEAAKLWSRAHPEYRALRDRRYREARKANGGRPLERPPGPRRKA